MFKTVVTLFRGSVAAADEELEDRTALLILDQQMRDAAAAVERASARWRWRSHRTSKKAASWKRPMRVSPISRPVPLRRSTAAARTSPRTPPKPSPPLRPIAMRR